MVTYTEGNIFESSAQVITNPINCVGVMGKGLALQFKQKYPQMFADYKARCAKREVKLGEPYLWDDEYVQILNFPTKDQWQQKSKLSYIEDGLKFIAENYTLLGIHSLALPPLGCGLGGLSWDEVQPLIEKYLGPLADLEVYVYVPKGASIKRSDDSKLEEGYTELRPEQAAQPSL